MNNDLRYYGNPMNWESTKGDCISREALKEEVRKHAEYYADRTKEDRYNVGYTECACEILDFIDNALTVEPERPKGEWAEFEGGYRCSNCDDIEVYTPNFCPNCGADMRKGGTENGKEN